MQLRWEKAPEKNDEEETMEGKMQRLRSDDVTAERYSEVRAI